MFQNAFAGAVTLTTAGSAASICPGICVRVKADPLIAAGLG